MRIACVVLFLLLKGPVVFVAAEEPARVAEPPSAERIAELVRQLGSEDFATRERATELLMFPTGSLRRAQAFWAWSADSSLDGKERT